MPKSKDTSNKTLKDTLADIDSHFGKGTVMRMGDREMLDIQSLVASTRSVKLRRNQVSTPKNMTITQSPYHGAGQVVICLAHVGDVSCLSLGSVEVLLAVMGPLFLSPPAW